MITSLLCYVTIWNSPADVTGSSVVDDGAKKDDKGNNVLAGFVFFFSHLYINTRKYMYFITRNVYFINAVAFERLTCIYPFCMHLQLNFVIVLYIMYFLYCEVPLILKEN